MKFRIYHYGNRFDRIFHDPTENYTDDFHPHVYLVDMNDPAQGYKTDMPEYFEVDETELPDRNEIPLEYWSINPVQKIVETDTAKYEADKNAAKAKKNRLKAAINKQSDPDLKELLMNMAKKAGEID